MYNICFYFLMFYCYSIIGWITECISCSIERRKIIHDRGFLIGPYCPIYGYGALGVYLIIMRYYHDFFSIFVMSMLGASVIEYVTSYFMEKMFKARWWDYSNVRFNLEGRICLKNAILFGICGIVIAYLLNPAILFIFNKIPKTILIIVGIILFISFIIDNIISFTIMSKLKSNLSNLKKDSTSDIDKQVREILEKYKFYVKKLFRSFPKAQFNGGEKIMLSIHNALENVDKIRKERKNKIKKIRRELKK